MEWLKSWFGYSKSEGSSTAPTPIPSATTTIATPPTAEFSKSANEDELRVENVRCSTTRHPAIYNRLAHSSSSSDDEDEHGGEEAEENEETPSSSNFDSGRRRSSSSSSNSQFPPSSSSSSFYRPNKKPEPIRPHKREASSTTKKAQLVPITGRLEFCQKLLTDFYSEKYLDISWPFHKPVNAVELVLHDYHKIIKQPMDMSTIKKKLEHGEYSEPAEFASDFKLMLDNCMLYYRDGDPIFDLGKRFMEVFERRWNDLPCEEGTSPSTTTNSSPAPVPRNEYIRRGIRDYDFKVLCDDFPDLDWQTYLNRQKTMPGKFQELKTHRKKIEDFLGNGREKKPRKGILQPPRDPPFGKATRHTNVLDYILHTTLKEAGRHKDAAPFLKPVDAVTLGIPHYHDKIPKAMDLKTIESRIKKLYYTTYTECVEDIETVFQNCYTFHGPEDDVTIMAQNVHAVVKKSLESAPKEEEDAEISWGKKRKPEGGYEYLGAKTSKRLRLEKLAGGAATEGNHQSTVQAIPQQFVAAASQDLDEEQEEEMNIAEIEMPPKGPKSAAEMAKWAKKQEEDKKKVQISLKTMAPTKKIIEKGNVFQSEKKKLSGPSSSSAINFEDDEEDDSNSTANIDPHTGKIREFSANHEKEKTSFANSAQNRGNRGTTAMEMRGTMERALIDEAKKMCLLCKRAFSSVNVLRKHVDKCELRRRSDRTEWGIPSHKLVMLNIPNDVDNAKISFAFSKVGYLPQDVRTNTKIDNRTNLVKTLAVVEFCDVKTASKFMQEYRGILSLEDGRRIIAEFARPDNMDGESYREDNNAGGGGRGLHESAKFHKN